MIRQLERIAVEHGDRLKVIPIERLNDLRVVIHNFRDQEELNDFQKWIVNGLYQFELPEVDFEIRSILLAAISHPFYAKVTFHREGIKKTFPCLVRPDIDSTEAYLKRFAKEKGYSIRPARNLPLKRLAVHSGLAVYGRNNITYVEGLGSNFSYAAYFSDIPCLEDTWGGALNAAACEKCSRCINICPTGAILKDRFLIDNQRCLSCVNEVPGEFPDWVSPDIHHTLYDCLFCQRICPMNAGQVDKILDGMSFSEEETEKLLAGEPLESFSEEGRTKIHKLGMDEWYGAISRNLKVLFEQAE